MILLRHLSTVFMLALLTACGTALNDSAVGTTGSATPALAGGAKSDFPSEPPLETAQEALDAALRCTGFEHPDKPTILLVHGTVTHGPEQYTWNYIPVLRSMGYDVCNVSYPDRGLGDQQISAEYVVNALRRLHAKTGRKVAIIGHSQGAGMPRWALKWWPSARNAVDDFVMHAGPNHGTTMASPGGMGPTSPLPMPPGIWQFMPESNFIKAVNQGDETPGDISYTSLYSATDELVQPFGPPFGDPTAALDLGLNNPKVTNVLLQDACPTNVVDHLSIGTTDPLAFALTMDAITHPGPANVERAGGLQLCLNPIPLPVTPAMPPTVLVDILMQEQYIPPAFEPVSAEPPLKPYAQP